MLIHVLRDGTQFGPYSLDVVQQYLAAGTLHPTDLAWHEGASGWMPLVAVRGVLHTNIATLGKEAADALAADEQAATQCIAEAEQVQELMNSSKLLAIWSLVVAFGLLAAFLVLRLGKPANSATLVCGILGGAKLVFAAIVGMMAMSRRDRRAKLIKQASDRKHLRAVVMKWKTNLLWVFVNPPPELAPSIYEGFAATNTDSKDAIIRAIKDDTLAQQDRDCTIAWKVIEALLKLQNPQMASLAVKTYAIEARSESARRRFVKSAGVTLVMLEFIGIVFFQGLYVPQQKKQLRQAMLEIEEAKKFCESKDFKRGMASMEKATQLYPNIVNTNEFKLGSGALWAGKGSKMKDHQEAIKSYLRATEFCPDNTDYWWLLGSLYLNNNQSDNALGAFKMVVEKKPDDALGWSTLGLTYAALGQFNEAIEACQKAVQLKPDFDFLHSGLGDVFALQGKKREAEEAYGRAAKVAGNSSDVWGNIGRGYLQTHNWMAAIQALEKYTRIDISSIDGFAMLSAAYSHVDRDSDAARAIAEAVQLDPKTANEWFLIGEAYNTMDKTLEAISAYKMATELQPNQIVSWLRLGDVYLYQGNPLAAIIVFEKATSIDPKREFAWQGLGIAYADQQNWSASEEAIKKAETLAPNEVAENQCNWGYLYRKQKKWSESLAAYQKALETDPNFARAFRGIGNVHFDQKQWKDAKTSFAKSLELNPSKDSKTRAKLNAAAYEEALERATKLAQAKEWINADAAVDEALQANPNDTQAKNLKSQIAESIAEINYQKAIDEAERNLKAKKFADTFVAAERAIKIRKGDPKAKELIEKVTPYVARKNSLGLKFVPVEDTNVHFCIWETRVQDYQAFVNATKRSWEKPSFEQGQTHPAVNVSWEDAKAFCKWLTEKERQEGGLTAGQEYRLPTDAEWSIAVGLGGENGNTPAQKDKQISDVYPWGKQWPPPLGKGNYGSSLNVDNYNTTSPVGSFAANKFEIYDLGGNVWEWCEDLYVPSGTLRVLRGGSWLTDYPVDLCLSRRIKEYPSYRDVYNGFRCVLVTGSSAR